MLHGLDQTKDHRTENEPPAASGTPSQPVTGQEAGSVCRKVIQAQDVCPICQEELLEKKQPVSYCRFGCGNNVHISCMKVWADHQKLSDREETVKCPLCREDFSSLKLLQEQVKNAAKLFTAAEREKPDRHLGVLCHICRVYPITGRCFKCTVCSYLYLCEDCSNKGCHPQHPFASRTKRRGKWHLVDEDLSDGQRGATFQPANTSINPEAADSLPENVLGCLPAVRVRSGSQLLAVGQQCRICLLDFTLGQRVRTLHCHHKFHTDCVDAILQKSNSCPLDGYVIYDPLTWRTSERKTSFKTASCLSSDRAKRPSNNLQDLFIQGVHTKVTPSHGSLKLEVLTGSSVMSDMFQGLCIATDPVMKEGKGELQTKQTALIPENGSSFDHRSTSRARSSKKTGTKHSPASAAAVTKVRPQPQLNLFVGLERLESDNTATSPARRTRPQRRRAAIKDTNNGLISELTGVFINTQEPRKTDT
ncbi:E3 ubiquitin-protein ligase ZSWIM2 isoform X2 [Centropristis striata]|nr:E3 ubiquitin-protein ligase ZSWIM2 isoform X2 [Centropristis striata]XP_059183740.1 E3 ubiquitin-protein ligase ZSWIM2 isoform X2 [Centropristis striata]